MPKRYEDFDVAVAARTINRDAEAQATAASKSSYKISACIFYAICRNLCSTSGADPAKRRS